MNNIADELYVLDDRDLSIVHAVKALLWKVVRSSLVTSAHVEVVAKAISVFDELPGVSGGLDISIGLNGPPRWFGEHEIFHWWEVLIEGQLIQVSSGGHFYRQSTGGDSFTCMTWSAVPGYSAELNDYLDSLHIVDDAMAFEPEVAQIDLKESGFSLTVSVDGEDVNEEEQDEDDLD